MKLMMTRCDWCKQGTENPKDWGICYIQKNIDLHENLEIKKFGIDLCEDCIDVLMEASIKTAAYPTGKTLKAAMQETFKEKVVK